MIPDKSTLEKMYVDQQMTSRTISREFGVVPQTVEKWLHRYGIPTRRRGPRSGAEHPGWKGGMTVANGGYILRYRPNHPYAKKYTGYVQEHRLVMEEKLGRYLSPEEVVHHIDGDATNNNPSNLRLFQSNGEHLAHELAGKCPEWTPDGLAKLHSLWKSRRKPLPEKEELELLYRTKSAEQIAAEYGCTQGTVLHRLREYGIRVCSVSEGWQKRFPWPSKEELERLLEDHSAAEIGRMLGGRDVRVVCWHLKQIGLSAKKAQDARSRKRLAQKSSGQSSPQPDGAES